MGKKNQFSDGRRSWTPEEVFELRLYYKNSGPEIPELLEKHTRQAICSKASGLGLRISKIIHYQKIADANRQERIIKKCKACSKEFKVTLSETHIKCCSMKCRDTISRIGLRITITCQNCGKKVTILESEFRLSGRKFCCKKCQIEYYRGERHPRWTGYDFRHSWTWKKLRDKALERDENRCYTCKSTADLNIHHIIPWSVKKLNMDWNLISLCRSCHQRAEAELRGSAGLSTLQIQFLTRNGEMQYKEA